MAKPSNHRWVKIQKSGSITIFFKYQKQTYQFAPVKGGRVDNPQDLLLANKVAGDIELAIKLNNFNGIEQWKPKQVILEVKPELTTLKSVWEGYKIAKKDKVSDASQVSMWKQADRCLDCLLQLNQVLEKTPIDEINLQVLMELLLSTYSPSTVSRVMRDLHAACNLAVKRKLISSNPLTGYKDELPDTPKSTRSKECYSLDEVNLIIQTFKSSKQPFIVQNYAPFIEFLFLTGVRPQLAIALTWGDIQGEKIVFNKGFTKGVVTQGKTTRETVYPMFPQLQQLIDRIENEFKEMDINEYCINPSDYLVFPSPKGKHIDLHNFTQRIWKPLITDLVKQGKLTKYLPTYHCRHSTATLLAKANIPSPTIAALLDTSEEMLRKHYFDNQELTNVVIPDLL